MGCEHKLKHLETDKQHHERNYTPVIEWTRVDRFYCEKCGEIIVKKKIADEISKPDWY